VAGLHAGEVELIAGKIGGVAVHIAARVASLANPDEVLVSRTIKDLSAVLDFASTIGEPTR
jgi:class 3 adenylate cyclase